MNSTCSAIHVKRYGALNRIDGNSRFDQNSSVGLHCWKCTYFVSHLAFIASLGVADFSVGVIINPLWVSKSVLNIWQSDIL